MRQTIRGPEIHLTRTHKNFVKRLFEIEVPELVEGTVEMTAIAREPGLRTKVVVAARQPGVDPVGAVVGMRGSRVQAVVEDLGGEKIDIIAHTDDPVEMIGRALSPAPILTVTVDEHLVPRNPRQPYRIWCSDESGRLCLTYFNGREDYLKKLLPPGEQRVVSGKVEIYQGEAQITHPDHVVPLSERESILRVEPVYGLTAGLTQRPVQKAIAAAVERAPDLAEWQDAAYLKQQKWSGWKASLARAHAPMESSDLAPDHPARARLAFDELLASQLAIAMVRHHNRSLPGRATRGDGRLQKRALASLPFQLTPDRKSTRLNSSHTDISRMPSSA